MTAISTGELKELCTNVLIKAGLRPQDAALTVDHYLENEMSGKSSHGMVRIEEAAKAVARWDIPKQDPAIEHDTGSMVRLNANGQIGAVAGMFATNEAITRAPKHGIALVGIHNYIASSGSMAYYLRRIADAGFIAFMGCNSVAMVAPPGGRERVIGTNPIGICIPGENGHFIADLATSAYAYGKIMVHKDKGEPVPDGVIIDANGNASTNPEDAYNGAILPLSGHKGFSLGLMIELMAGPLIGAKAVKKELCDEDGLFIIAIDPNAMGNSKFYEEVFETLNTIKASATAPGNKEISIAGERSAKTLKETIQAEQLNVADTTLQKLKDLAA